MINALKYAHLLTMAIWIGSMVFFSFIAAPAIFKTFDRKTAGEIVGAIFPKYFLLEEVAVALALVTLGLLGSKIGFTGGVKAALAILAVMGGLVFYSGMVNGPQARSVKAEIYGGTASEERLGELKEAFKKLHGVSMGVNMTTLLLGLVVLYLAIGYLAAPVRIE
jgi:uncharacterized membrane protein